MDDLISREAAIEALLTAAHINLSDAQAYFLEKALNEIPSAQPTLYGYQIEHLALIARVMEKEGVTPEKAVETFGNISKIVQIIVEEQREIIRKAVEEWGDLISRSAAIEAIDELVSTMSVCVSMEECKGMNWMKRRAIAAIRELPTAAGPKWIPVSEGLPEEDRNVLVSVHFLGLEIKHKTGWNDHIKESWYVDIASQIDGEWTSASDEYKVAKKRHIVTAWMPLPEPWKGEDNGRNTGI